MRIRLAELSQDRKLGAVDQSRGAEVVRGFERPDQLETSGELQFPVEKLFDRTLQTSADDYTPTDFL